MFITLVTILMHAVSYVTATALMHLYGGSIPEEHLAALEHLQASAVLYSYRLSRKLAEAYVLMPKRHWEPAVQACIDACVSLGQHPGLILVLLVLAILCGIVRYWVVLSVVQWQTATTTGAGTAGDAVLGHVCRVAIVGYLPDSMCWILRMLVQLLALLS